MASFPGRESFLPALLGWQQSTNMQTQRENATALQGTQTHFINPLYYRWKAGVFECIRSPAATVTQNYIVCWTTVCHLCKNRQKTFPMRSDKNRSCLFKSTPSLEEKKKQDEIANPWNESKGSLFLLEQQWVLLIMCSETPALEWIGPTVQPQNKLHISLNLIGKINGMPYNGGNSKN